MSEKKFADIVAREGIALPAVSAAERSLPLPAVLLPDWEDAAGSESCYAANGTDIRRLQKSSKEKPEKSIDLHGLTVAEAHAVLDNFLAVALRDSRRHVEIVHGRGTHSGGRAVLRDKTRQWLKKCDKVLGYIEVRNNPGALRVLLRRA